jgi:hypothetical protein
METIVAGSTSENETSTTQTSELESQPTISVVQVALPNQPVQVQSVIQANQPSVIQTAGQNLQTIQVVTPGDTDLDDDIDGKRRREILARRPSYRKILNDLSSSDTPTITVAKIEEESNSSQNSQDSEANEAATNLTTTVVPAHTIQIAAHGDGTTSGGLQTLTMTNNTNTATAGTTIVQYAQGPDGQFFIPVSSIGGAAVQAYQISTPAAAATTLPQGVVMQTAGATLSPQQLSEEASRKRELRLLKNRDAARECRRKKKEYVKCLENRVAVLENQNKTLIEELKSLKELYCQKEG